MRKFCGLFSCVITVTALSLFGSTVVFASAGYHTLSYSDMGVENIEFPSDFAIITRTEYYNTESLEDDYGADVSSIRDNMDGTNTYVCAMSYDFDYEIDMDFSEMDEGFYIGDCKDFTDEDFDEMFSSLVPLGAENLKITYVEMNETPAIKMTAYLSSLDQYLEGYMCTSKAGDKYYSVLYKMYSYGSRPTSSMENVLNHAINNSVIVQPESYIEEQAKKSVFSDMIGESMYKGLVGAASGLMLGIIAFIINRVRRRHEKEEKKAEDICENRIDNMTQNEEINIVEENIVTEVVEETIKSEIVDTEKSETTESRDNEVKAIPKRLFCRKCGAELLLDSEFCNKCGTKVIR